MLHGYNQSTRHSLATVLLGAFLLVGLFLGLGQVSPATSLAQGPRQADVVVQFDDQKMLVRTVHFASAISGLDALQQSGLDIETRDFGELGLAVCSIEGVGCPADNCFCDPDRFWNYRYWDGAAWQRHPVGAGSSVVSQTGAVEGWRWGEFDGADLPATRALAAQAGLSWLAARQTITTGGYGDSVGAAAETALALGANGESADRWRGGSSAPSLLSYLLQNGPTYAGTDVSASGKLAVALNAADGCWPDGAALPADYYNPALDAFSDQAGHLSWGLLGTRAFMEDLPAGSVQQLIDLALESGGWEWQVGFGRDTNTTALAIQALLGAGKPISSTEIISGLAFLHSAQNPDGGFPYDPLASFGSESDTNSTAYVVQALIAAGQDLAGDEWTVGGRTPVDFLLGQQIPDGGFAYQASGDSNLVATQQAIPALLGKSYPLRPGALRSCTLGELPVSVSAGGQTTLSYSNVTVEVSFPPATRSTSFLVTFRQAPVSSTRGVHVLGQSLVVEAQTSGGTPVTQFDAPFTLRVTYDDSAVVGIDETALELLYFDEDQMQWIGLNTVVDPDANTLTAEVDHLTQFVAGLLLDESLHLPALSVEADE